MNRPKHDPETLANRREILKREARLRRFGYDSPAAIQFVLAQALPLGGAVLEIGTGKGRFLVRLARHVAAVTTVDIAAEEQRCARLNARYARVEEKIRFVLRDAARLPWRDCTFDAVATMNAMHHIAHFRQVLKEMLRVVKPGGKIVLADFSPRGFQIVARAPSRGENACARASRLSRAAAIVAGAWPSHAAAEGLQPRGVGSACSRRGCVGPL